MADWNDILKNDEPLNEQELLKYIEGNPSEQERFAIEKQMTDSAFVNDAIEGLKQFEHPNQLQALKDQLNKQLKKEINKKGKRKKIRKIQDQQWLVVAILSILFLCIVGYLLIHFYSK